MTPKATKKNTGGVPNPLRTLGDASNVLATAGGWSGGGSEPWLSNYWPGVTQADFGSYYGNELDPSKTSPMVIANYNLSGYIADLSIPEETIITRWVQHQAGHSSNAAGL